VPLLGRGRWPQEALAYVIEGERLQRIGLTGEGGGGGGGEGGGGGGGGDFGGK